MEGVTSFLVYLNQLSRKINSQALIGRQEFERMWKSGGDETTRASEELMELMKEVIEMGDKQVFSFFMEQVVGKQTVLAKVGPNAFACFKVGFMAANELAINKNFQSSRRFKYELGVNPNQLKWVDAVWNFFFVVEDKKVIAEVVSFIRQLYIEWCEQLQSQTLEIRKELMAICLDQLKLAIHKKEKMNRCYFLIKELLDETECNGAGNVLSHSCLIKGELIEITIKNGITMGVDIQKLIKIKINSNCTILKLRGEIARQAKCQWEEVDLKI